MRNTTLPTRSTPGGRATSARRATLGKALISATAVAQMVGPYIFDFNETHIYNPTWPPHAKFHNAQTMSSGVVLSIATLINLWRPGSGRVGVDAAALSASVYWVSQVSAYLYPGTASVDPPGEDNWPQLRYAIPIMTVVAAGWALSRGDARTTRRTR